MRNIHRVQAEGATVKRQIVALLRQQFRMMMDCFFNTGADFELINNGEFVRSDMTTIPAHICDDYGMRLLVASMNHEGRFDIDGECIGTLAECFTRRGLSTRFGVGVDSADAECSVCINDIEKVQSVTLHIPPHVTCAVLTEIRDELRSIVLIQQLKQPCYGNW